MTNLFPDQKIRRVRPKVLSVDPDFSTLLEIFLMAWNIRRSQQNMKSHPFSRESGGISKWDGSILSGATPQLGEGF